MEGVYIRESLVPEIALGCPRAIVAAQGLERCDTGMRKCIISMWPGDSIGTGSDGEK